MTLFWILAGAMVCMAVLFVALPLAKGPARRDQASRDELNLTIRKDQLAELKRDLEAGTLSPEQYEEGKLEVERGLVEDVSGSPEEDLQEDARTVSPRLAMLVGLIIPVVAVSLYLQLGSIKALDPAATAALPQVAGDDAAHEITEDKLASMVQGLADRLQEQPDDAEGWMMLGRSYSVLRQFPKAAEAYARAYAIMGDHPDVLANYADALAMANGGEFTPQAIEMVEKAVKADPTHQKALWLAGTAAYERQDYGRALTLWSALAAQLPPGSDTRRTMDANVAEVRSLMGDSAPPLPEPTEQMAAADTGKHSVSGVVRLSPEIADRVKPGATLFIYAKAAQGPPMPLAIHRGPVEDFPLRFLLDETMAMMPAMSLAKFDQVIVGARISMSGNAIAQSGDLQGIIGPLPVGSEGLEITISEVVP